MAGNDELTRQFIESLKDNRSALTSIQDEMRRTEARLFEQIAEMRRELAEVKTTQTAVAVLVERVKQLEEANADRFRVIHHRIDDAECSIESTEKTMIERFNRLDQRGTDLWTRWIAIVALAATALQTLKAFLPGK